MHSFAAKYILIFFFLTALSWFSVACGSDPGNSSGDDTQVTREQESHSGEKDSQTGSSDSQGHATSNPDVSAVDTSKISPAQVVELYNRYLRDRNFKGAYELHTTKFKNSNITYEMFSKMFDEAVPQGTQVVSFQIVYEKINGENASVRYSETDTVPGKPDHTESNTVELRKENEGWRIASY